MEDTPKTLGMPQEKDNKDPLPPIIASPNPLTLLQEQRAVLKQREDLLRQELLKPQDPMQFPVPEDEKINPLMAIGAGLRAAGGDSSSLDALIERKAQAADYQREIVAQNQALQVEHEYNAVGRQINILDQLNETLGLQAELMDVKAEGFDFDAMAPGEIENWLDDVAEDVYDLDSYIANPNVYRAFQASGYAIPDDPEAEYMNIRRAAAGKLATAQSKRPKAEDSKQAGLLTADKMQSTWGGPIEDAIAQIKAGVTRDPEGKEIPLSVEEIDKLERDVFVIVQRIDPESAGAEAYVTSIIEDIMDAKESARFIRAAADQPEMAERVNALVSELRGKQAEIARAKVNERRLEVGAPPIGMGFGAGEAGFQAQMNFSDNPLNEVAKGLEALDRWYKDTATVTAEENPFKSNGFRMENGGIVIDRRK
jgi:hypothetical protein